MEQDYTIPQQALTEDGYIINQGLLQNIPYGRYDSKRCGCGWICIYNVMKALNKEKSVKQIIDFLTKYTLFNGALGTTMRGLKKYLKAHKIRYKMCMGKDNISRYAHITPCGIIYYCAGKTMHFVAYKRLEDNSFQFYNANYGVKDHVTTIEDFYKGKPPITISLAVF